jgi:myo-inositol-1(or 4)-monophosphatase
MQTLSLLPRVINIATQAGLFIQKERQNFSYEKVEVKGLNDMVSYVDKGAEELIVRGLREIFPESGFITEENTASNKEEYNWIIDPLDGTTNFIHGIPCCAVSIALEWNNKIILGVVYEVTRQECFSAHVGEGAFLNGKRISVSNRATLSESLVGTGFPIYNFSRMESFLKALDYFMRNTHGVRRIGAAAADLCFLACGRLDAFFEYNLNPWDVAAGALIVKEAGGTVSDFSGGSNWLFGKEIACTNGKVRDEFNKKILEFFGE